MTIDAHRKYGPVRDNRGPVVQGDGNLVINQPPSSTGQVSSEHRVDPRFEVPVPPLSISIPMGGVGAVELMTVSNLGVSGSAAPVLWGLGALLLSIGLALALLWHRTRGEDPVILLGGTTFQRNITTGRIHAVSLYVRCPFCPEGRDSWMSVQHRDKGAVLVCPRNTGRHVLGLDLTQFPALR